MAWHGDTVTDPFVYLELDHRKLAALLRKLRSNEEGVRTKRRLQVEIERALLLHIELVENLLYPALVQGGEIHDRVVEGYSEHQILRLLLNELSLMRVGTEEWDAKVGALAENFTEHCDAEEALLRHAHETISVATTRQLTDAMQSVLQSPRFNQAFIAPSR